MEHSPFLELMTGQAEAQCAAARESACAEAARIRDEARQAADAHRAQTLQAVERELAVQAERARERARSEAQMVLLTTKDRIAEEVLRAVEARLAEVAAGDGFPAILDALLAELLPEAPSDPVVLAPPAHAERVRQRLAAHGHAGIRVEPSASLKDGVAIQDAGRTVRITNTLSTRFTKLESEARKHCLARLFPKEAQV